MNPNFMTLDTAESYRLLEAKWDDHEDVLLEVFANNPETGVLDNRWDDYDKLDWNEYCEKRDAGALYDKFVRLYWADEEDSGLQNFDSKDVAEAVKATLVAMDNLPSHFTITLHEFRNRKVLDIIEDLSRQRGFSSCKARDDDGERRYYLDDKRFIEQLGYFATTGEAFSDSLCLKQSFINFLGNGDTEAEIDAFDENTIVPSYGIEYRFDVDWEAFDWESAVAEQLIGCRFGDEVQSILNMFKVI